MSRPKRATPRKRQESAFDRARAALVPKIKSPKRPAGKRKAGKASGTRTRKPAARRSATRKKAVRRRRTQRFIRIFTNGRTVSVQVSRKTASYVGGYLSAVGQFLDTNDPVHLKPYVGASVKDARGKVHPLEVRRNVLYRLNAAVEPFEEIYRLVA